MRNSASRRTGKRARGRLESIKAVGVEAFIFFSAPVVFLSWYVGEVNGGQSLVLRHFELVLLLGITLLIARGLAGAIAATSRFRIVLSSVIVVVTLAVLWSYYLAVFLGLKMWGRVISLDIIQTYSGSQMLAMLSAIQLEWWMVLLPLTIFLSVAIVLCYQWLKRNDWIERIRSHCSPITQGLVLIGVGSIIVLRIADFVSVPTAEDLEPVSLTFFADQSVVSLQGLAIDPLVSQEMDSRANRVRTTYSFDQDFEKRNVVLIVVDGLRADRMGVLGSARPTTPFLSSLREEGRIGLLGRLYSACAESACGLLAMNSSKHPHQFSESPITISEILQGFGYEIHRYLSGDHSNFYGISSYYGPSDIFFDGSDQIHYANDDRLVIERIGEMEPWQGMPTYINIHLMSAHSLGRRWEQHWRYLPASNYTLPALRDKPSALNYYDNGVEQVDSAIAEILSELSEKGYLEDAVVMVTADHGEMLGEHGIWRHANTLHDPAVSIPLVLIPRWGPKVAKPNEISFGGQVDIGPILFGALGLKTPSTWVGRSDVEHGINRVIFLRQGPLVGLVEVDQNRKWKYWVDLRDGEQFAFDLASDPGENYNAIERVPASKLKEWQALILDVASRVGTGFIQSQDHHKLEDIRHFLGPDNMHRPAEQ